jgi:hypothetical protein
MNRKIFALLSACLLLVSLLAGCGKKIDSPFVGTWNAAKYAMSGTEMSVDELGESSLEFKDSGKVTVTFLGQSGSGTWEPGDAGLVIRDDSDEFPCTLQGTTLVMDYSGVQMYFERDGGYAGTPGPEPTPAEVGYFRITGLSSDGTELTGDDLKSMSLDYFYVLFREDGTADLQTDSLSGCTWADGVLTSDGDGTEYAYTLDGDTLTMTLDGTSITFTRAEQPDVLPAPPEEPSEADASGAAGSSGASSIPQLGSADDASLTPGQVWSGEWYGSLSVTKGYGSWEDSAGNLLSADCVVNIEEGNDFFEVYLPDAGYDESPYISMYIKADAEHFEIDDADAWVSDMTIPEDNFSDYYAIFVPGHGNLVSISSHYDDPEEAGAGFDFTLEMRPYGSVFNKDYDTLPPDYDDYEAYLYSDDYDGDVVDGETGEVLVDRGSPVYVPGAAAHSGGGNKIGAAGGN